MSGSLGSASVGLSPANCHAYASWRGVPRSGLDGGDSRVRGTRDGHSASSPPRSAVRARSAMRSALRGGDGRVSPSASPTSSQRADEFGSRRCASALGLRGNARTIYDNVFKRTKTPHARHTAREMHTYRLAPRAYLPRAGTGAPAHRTARPRMAMHTRRATRHARTDHILRSLARAAPRACPRGARRARGPRQHARHRRHAHLTASSTTTHGASTTHAGSTVR